MRGAALSVERGPRGDTRPRVGRAVLGGPASQRLRADLAAIDRIFAEVLALSASDELAAQLTALERGEPLRVPHRHASSGTGLTPGQALAERTRHETSHAFVHALAPRAPAWLDEGLACAFETLELRPGGEIRLRPNARRHGVLRSASRSGALPDLAKLKQLSPEALSRDAAAAASWALAFSLLRTPEGRETLRALLQGQAPQGFAAEPATLPRSWRRTASGAVAALTLIPAEPPPEPEPPSEIASADELAEPRPSYRHKLRCVRGVVGAGTPAERPALFCGGRRRLIRVR
jgi:hypothetical protein